jgi:hypothetical protein
LAELARLERSLAGIDASERRAKARIEAEAQSRRAVPASERDALAAALERFCRSELRRPGRLASGQGAKSRRLALGRVGYRVAHAVVIRSEADALRSLSATPEGRRFLRVSTAIDREALRAYFLRATGRGANAPRRKTQARLLRRLRESGVRLARRDYWFYELNRQALGSWG